MLDIEIRRSFKLLDQLAGLLARTIIRNDHLEVLVGLVEVAMQRQRQPFRGVIGAEDYACLHRLKPAVKFRKNRDTLRENQRLHLCRHR